MQRRNFLKAMGILAGGVILSACQRLLGKSTPEPQPTDIPPSGTPTASQTPSPTVTETPTPTDTSTPTQIGTPTPVVVTLLEPVDGSQLPASGRVRFVWQPIEGVLTYYLQINRQEIIITSLKTQLPQLDFYLEYLPWAGDYTWQVTARDPNGGTLAVSQPWTFHKPQSVLPEKTSTPGGSSAGVEPTKTLGGPSVGGATTTGTDGGD